MAPVDVNHHAPTLSGHLSWYHWLVVAASLMLTFSAWYITSQQTAQKSEAQFRVQANQIVVLVRERIEKYEEALLAGVAALHAMPANASRDDWLVFASSLKIESRFPGINGIGVIHYISPEKLPSYLAWQKQTMPDFHIYPSHNKNEFWPITYIEPQAANMKAVGLDMAHEINRYTAAIKARDTGLAQITGPIILVQDAKKTPGFLFYAPWYSGNEMLETQGDRQQNFLGLVYAPFIMYKLMDGTLANTNRQVNFSIHDGTEELYNELSPSSENFDSQPMYIEDVAVELYGRQWRFTVQSSLLFREQNNQNQPLIILIGGILINALLLVVFFVLARANRQAKRYADEVTAHIVEQQLDLERTHQRLSGAMDAMLDGLVVIDGKGIILECNKAIELILGYAKEELLGKNVKSLMPESDASKHDGYLAQSSLADGTGSIIGQERVLHALRSDGSEIPIRLCVTKSQVEGEVFYTGIIHDLTAITESRQRADEFDQLSKAAIHATRAGFSIVNSQYNLVEVNISLAHWLGYSSSEMIGLNMSAIIPAQECESIEKVLHALFTGELETESRECQYQHKEGYLVWGFMTAAVVRRKNADIAYVVVQIIDINDQKKLAQNLESRNLALEEANRELDQFAFVASHDLKAPLRGITQLAQWIEEDLKGNLEPQTLQYLSLLHNRIERLDRLLDDLLSYSRVGRKDGDIRTIDIKDSIRETFKLLSPPEGITLQCDVSMSELETLTTPLELVLRNLMSNAIKHHDRTIGTVKVSAFQSESDYQFSVEDDGPGIPLEHHERIFGLFHTLKPRDQVEGSGIGLAIIKKILDRYHCKYQIECEAERGTRFVFTWPTAKQLREYLNE